MSESLQELTVELERLANRVKMQRVRNVTEHQAGQKSRPAGEPDPYTQPDEWRKAINEKLARSRHGL